MRYRAKQVEIEAFEFTGTIASGERLVEMFPHAIVLGRNGLGEYDGRMILQTNDGPTNVHEGNFVVKLVDGSLSKMNPIEFNSKYDRVHQFVAGSLATEPGA